MTDNNYKSLVIATFTDNMKSWLSVLEGTPANNSTPYCDTTGHPTVSVGVNLTVRSYLQQYIHDAETNNQLTPGSAQETVLNNLLSTTYASPSEFQTAVTNYETQYDVTSLPTLTAQQTTDIFTFAYNEQYAVLFNPTKPTEPGDQPLGYACRPIYNIDVNALENSDEGLALMSLSYNILGGNPGSHLLSDLNQSNFNRVDAWFQIRYESNGGSSQSGGIAKRRYEESEVFGLYAPDDSASGPTVAPLSEALQIYSELSIPSIKLDTTNSISKGQTFRDYAFNYESEYQSYVTMAYADLQSPPMVDTDIGGFSVGTLESELQSAASTLVSNYVTNTALNPWVGSFASTSFDSLDVQVALAQGGSDLVASQRTDYQLGTGGYENSVLIARGGGDTLDGSGHGNDALIGGSGADTIIVGDGNDYIVAGGTGGDLIGGALSAPGMGAMGSGNDTIVLGDAVHAAADGTDTVWAGTGDETFYLSPDDSDVIHLNPLGGTVHFELVGADGTLTPLAIDAKGLSGTAGSYVDATANALVLATPNLDGTQTVKVIGLGAPAASANDVMAPMALDSTLPAAPFSGVLELDNFQGDSDAGITLSDGTATTPGTSNLGSYTSTTYSNHTEYQDLTSSYGGDSMVGASTTGGNYNLIEGEGNAGYIYAGDGNNEAFADDTRYSPVGEVFSYPLSVVMQGGSGNQLLVGMGDDGSSGNGNETILGGDMGSDTAAWTAIDGGGAHVNALLVGGSQNSLILGGIGTDTIVAGSTTAGSGKPDPITFALAGLSYWAAQSQSAPGGGSVTVTGEPEVSVPTFTDPANFQIDIALQQLDGSYATPFGLLGSSSNSGTDDNGGWSISGDPSWTLPGSLLIGGSGQDFLIGNSGDDTLVGGTPANPVAGTVDEVLVGGGGTNVIYGGGGTELIFADLSAAGDANWADLNPSDADTIYGGSGNEYIYGSGGNDVFHGGPGNYTINTGNGNSYVEAGSGNTIVNGGMGNDTIITGSGADSITTGDGNSYVEVQGGQSTIATGAGSDTIEGTGGDALITEGSGTTTILVGPGAGTYTVESGTSTAVQLQGGLTESTLIARDINGDLELSDGDSDTLIRFTGYFAGGSGNVGVQFEDGTTWGASQILAASMTPRTDGGDDTLIGSDGSDSITAGYGDTLIVGVSGNNTLTGGAGNDTIQGGSGADTIEGGSGSTQIKGGSGSETYVFNLGDGSDTINEDATAAGTDTLIFGIGITQSGATFSEDSSGGLLIGFDTLSTSTVDVPNFFEGGSPQHQIGTFQFADGSSLTRDQVIASFTAIDGTTGNDELYGTPGADYFDGKGGNDTEIGSRSGYGGSDTFVFNAGYGQLKILESYSSDQHPVLKLGPGITASSLKVVANGNDGDGLEGLIITDGIDGDQIIINQMFWNDGLGDVSGVQKVQFADGTVLTHDQLIQKEIDGATTGSDTLYGSTGADYIDGKGGGDFEDGNTGSDTFVFNAGYGALGIREFYMNGQSPVLQLGEGISESSLHITGDPKNIILSDGISGDQIILYGILNSSYPSESSQAVYDGIQELTLYSGTTLTRDQLVRMETTGTSGDETLYGSAGADYFDGEGGNDIEYGNGGSDTFIFDANYGHLEVNDANASIGLDPPVIQFGPSITATDVRVKSDGRNLEIYDGIDGDQVKLDDGMWEAANSSQVFPVLKLSDGTTFNIEQLIQIETSGSGTLGDDSLYGSPEDELFDGKGGNDYENGGDGNDTYVFNAGYGKLLIDAQPNTVTSDGMTPKTGILELGAGLSVTNLQATEGQQHELILSAGLTSDQITLQPVAGNGPITWGIDVESADGSTLDRNQLVQLVSHLDSTTGSDYLVGTAGADVLDGDGGNDFELGNGGGDTFVFKSGYGTLEVGKEFGYTLQLGPGITASNLGAFESHSGNGDDLILTDGTPGDLIRLDDVYQDAIGSNVVRFSDGTTRSVSQLINQVRYYYSGPEAYRVGLGADNQRLLYSSDAPSIDIFYVDGITNTDVSARGNTGGDLILTNKFTGSQFVIPGYFNGPQNVTVHFADSVTWGGAQILQALRIGGPGNDTLQGTTAPELFDGEGGNDSIGGGGGNDTFVFNSGYGDLEINESYTTGQDPVLQLGAGIAASALQVSASGNNLVLTDGVQGDQVTLDQMWSSATSGVAAVQLADGTTFTRNQLLQMGSQSNLVGTTGDDLLTGTAGADLFDGEGGDDTAIGGGGDDTFVFNSGYGDLEINESYLSGQQPVLQLGTGFNATTLIVSVAGSNLVLTSGSSSDESPRVLWRLFGLSQASTTAA